MKHCGRRDFTRLMGGLGLTLATAPLWPRRALAAGDEGPRRIDLRDGAWLLDSGYSNVLVLEAPEGLLLAGGVRADDAEALGAVLDEAGDTSPRVLYNTHWFWDHTGSNERLRSLGAERIIAHENTRLWLGNDFYVDWQERHYPPRPAQALPNDTFYKTHRLDFGGERVDSGLLFQAITDGDIYVFLRERNILVAGDVVGNQRFPVPDPVTGGWLGALVEAQGRLLELADADTLIIPADGGVMSRDDLAGQHAMMVEMRERIYEFARQGKGPQAMLAEGVAEGFEQWGDPSRFVLNCYPGLGRHYREIDGVV